MAVSYVAAGTVASATNPVSSVPGLPAGIVPGDLLVAIGVIRTAAGNYTAPAGWSATVYARNTSTPSIAVSTRVYVSGDAAPSFSRGTNSANTDVIFQVHAFRGASAIGTLGTVYTSGATTGTTIGPITGVSIAAGGMAVMVGAQGDDFGTPTTPGGWTVRMSQESTAGTDASIVAYTRPSTIAETSPSTTLTSAPTAATTRVGVQFAVTVATPNPLLSTLTDDFTAVNNTKWTYSAGASVTGGNLVLTNTAFNYATTPTVYDLTGSSVYGDLVTPPPNGSAWLQLDQSSSGTRQNALLFQVTGGNLNAIRYVGGTATTVATATFNATNHRYLRFTEGAGVVRWWTSSDATTWTSFGSWAATIAVSALYFAPGCESGTSGTVVWGGVNVPGSALPTAPTVPQTVGSGAYLRTTSGGTQIFKYEVQPSASFTGAEGRAYLYLPGTKTVGTSAKLALWGGGYGDTSDWFLDSHPSNPSGVVDALADAGYIQINVEIEKTWGNQNALNRYTRARSWAYTNWSIPVFGTVFLGFSMGALTGANLLQIKPFPIAGAYLASPAADLASIGDTSAPAGEYADTARTAYSTDASGFTAACAAYDPLQQSAADYAGVRCWIATSPDDNTAVASVHGTPLYNLIDSEPTATPTAVAITGDHGDPSTFSAASTITGYMTSAVTAASSTSVLDRWTTALAGRASTPARYLSIGESLAEGQGASTVDLRYFAKVTAQLRAAYPTSGVAGGAGYIPARRRVYAPDSGAWREGTTSQSGTFTHQTNGYANIGHKLLIMEQTSSMVFTVSGTAVDLDWTRIPAGGSFTWAVDGGSTTTVSTAGTYLASVLTRITFGSRGSHTITIVCTTSAQVYFGGVYVYDQDETKGVWGIDGGWTSATVASPYLEDVGSTGWPATLALMPPDLVTIELNGNDIINGTNLTTFEANARQLIGLLMALTPPPSIVWLTSYQIRSDLTANSAAPYDAKIKTLAAELGFGVVSWYDTIDQIGTGTSTSTLFQSDGIHPNDAGHTLLANSVLAYVAPDSLSKRPRHPHRAAVIRASCW